MNHGKDICQIVLKNLNNVVKDDLINNMKQFFCQCITYYVRIVSTVSGESRTVIGEKGIKRINIWAYAMQKVKLNF